MYRLLPAVLIRAHERVHRRVHCSEKCTGVRAKAAAMNPPMNPLVNSRMNQPMNVLVNSSLITVLILVMDLPMGLNDSSIGEPAGEFADVLICEPFARIWGGLLPSRGAACVCRAPGVAAPLPPDGPGRAHRGGALSPQGPARFTIQASRQCEDSAESTLNADTPGAVVC